MTETLIVKGRIKEEVQDCNIAVEFFQKLNKEVLAIVRKARERAYANGRKTLYARDL